MISVRCKNNRPKIKKDILVPTMNNFEEYLRQGEPNKSEKAKVWKMAIGLQQVDGLKAVWEGEIYHQKVHDEQ